MLRRPHPIATLLLALLVVGMPRAWSAEPDAFKVDSVLVATFQAEDRALQSEAARLQALVADAVGRRHLTLPMTEVPAFEAYDAITYVQGCPPGRYVGCALVVGMRGPVDWVVGATVREAPVGLEATVVFVDVARNEKLLELPVLFDGTDDVVLAGRLAEVLDAVIAGEVQYVDLRGDVEAEAAEEAEATEVKRERIVTEGIELIAFEEDLGDVERSRELRVKRLKLTGRDLDEMMAREGGAPWVRWGWSRDAYRRFRNQGATRAAWERRLRGRQGEILIGGSVLGLASGPWVQRWEGWYARDPDTLDIAEQALVLDLDRGLERAWELQVGVGVLPWLEVYAFGGPSLLTWRWREVQVVPGDDDRRGTPELADKTVSTWKVGGRVGFAPFPAWPARPVLHAGAVYWQGTDPTAVVQPTITLDPLPPSWMVLVQLQPGAEVDLGRVAYVWARADIAIPLAGRVAQEDATPGTLLDGRPRPDIANDGISVGGLLGVTFRIHLRREGRRRAAGPED